MASEATDQEASPKSASTDVQKWHNGFGSGLQLTPAQCNAVVLYISTGDYTLKQIAALCNTSLSVVWRVRKTMNKSRDPVQLNPSTKNKGGRKRKFSKEMLEQLAEHMKTHPGETQRALTRWCSENLGLECNSTTISRLLKRNGFKTEHMARREELVKARSTDHPPEVISD